MAGGENGFNQAIELSADTLSNVKFVQEKRLISKFFDEISQDTGKIVFGIKDTLTCLEMGAVETLIVYEDLAVDRVSILNPSTGGRISTSPLEAVGNGAHLPAHCVAKCCSLILLALAVLLSKVTAALSSVCRHVVTNLCYEL